ncbi:sulfide/dihydroorotate dehydrogenase-like FAD/NAD-binding protein [Clostridium gasigenes]|uniref:NAD(P)H-flavin reductase n=1 Tax=Clostridium gasigenes TaxID=94869 RepID=A0A1H0N9V3_9CLOT|nr:sulfide/dihydroorotate dehydrogenase-like FAD/NAD-binding protein [Clostridium gasigenes]MBB6623859.1 sulfide/dihydroorotate dehydrogenase-like FAD/NAD-binding protein [Clostridium gasigenes]MBU3087405.1 sulfide/dihydroorotate dehydrogenase-like FAD/NAD-binding protein [Clostridium gasigenes]MBU3131622.1 sulfide/dihydroorotate dehydrogenase-like FAD/NAD-binding protein [Clostridium gasigenes]SDO89070.1 NAD(P)H-flavin reductase [Clostridium gasigenes]
MFKETIDCIDAGSEYCPCHLAESGDCILCSQLHGSCFCDCSNWKGVCIYQEFKYNGEKAKEGRKTFNCLVEEKLLYENDVLLLKFKAPHKLAIDLVKPGGYIFIRTDPNVYFDVPISILESDIETNIITIMIEVRGIKTKKLLGIEKGGEITIRGPYWNGVFGLKNIQKQKNRNVLIISRGIGMAPMMPVIQKFTANNNKVYLLLDKEPYKDNYVKEYLDKYNVTPIFMNTIDKGDISSECKSMINTFISEKNISNIHIAGADILTYKIIDYMNEINNTKVLLSCCNNTKMCCGEGICGSCTTRFSGHRVKRFCKVQADPRNVFEGRRFI